MSRLLCLPCVCVSDEVRTTPTFRRCRRRRPASPPPPADLCRQHLYKIRSGVPQGSILGPVLYLIFTADIPTDNKTFIATYADDTAIMSVHENAAISSSNLQKHITEVEQWMKTWRIKANQSKSAHVTFTLRKGDCPPITLNGEQIPSQ
ncbi:RNA-directed DNA polymerase from mobile element jockey [Eumeta japonica]|uniref:RNA-directed DNA polymerase from mobile element jockey n=1 Tax=Eumeta variegata TaxID=151549 RepID=A0A4C2A030_EUMVA|nr:RNA-directed DNA polymerase from mobile element jockey [Eumeta japonica]